MWMDKANCSSGIEFKLSLRKRVSGVKLKLRSCQGWPLHIHTLKNHCLNWTLGHGRWWLFDQVINIISPHVNSESQQSIILSINAILDNVFLSWIDNKPLASDIWWSFYQSTLRLDEWFVISLSNILFH